MGITTSAGLISGIPIDDLVSQLLAVEQRPSVLLLNQKTALQTTSAEFSVLSLRLSGLKDAASSLSSLSNFNGNAVSVTKPSSGPDLLSASVDSTAIPGTSQVKVNQLAQAHSIGAQGFVDQDTTGVASASGTFKVKAGLAGKEISVAVTTSTTLLQLRDAINTANGDIAAAIVNDGSGSNPYRLSLTSTKTGSANTVSISSNPTTLDFTNKKIEAAFATTTNSYAGTVSSNAGNTYTGTTNKSFLVKIVAGGDPATATYKYSIDGGITFLGANGAAFDGTNAITTQTSLTNYIDGAVSSNSTNEGVQVSFGAASGTLVVDDSFNIDVFNPSLQAANDAVIEVGNLTLVKSSNTVTDAIQGVTLNLAKADTTETIDVVVTAETSSIQSLVNGFVSAYNDAIEYLNDQLTFDPDLGEANPLLGDFTTSTMKRKLQDLITSTVPGASSTVNSLSAIGITSDETTGELTFNSSDLDAAIAKNIDDVTRLFIGIGVPTNSAVDFVSKTVSTQPGTYGIQISTAPTKATAEGANAVLSGGIVAPETLSVNFFTDVQTVGATPVSTQVSLAIGSTVNDIVNALNSAFATKKMAVSASNDGGKVKITSTGFGDDFKVEVLSNLNDAANQSGFSNTLTIGTGVDVKGTINGRAATGVGDVLTSSSGGTEDGLAIRIPPATTGSLGNITVSAGIADRMVSVIEAAVKENGTIQARQDGLGNSIEDIDAQIARKDVQLLAFEQRTREQFQRLEVLLGQLQTQSQALASTLSGLQNLATVISNR